MRILAIETATAACSVALVDEGTLIAAAHEVVGRGHAERLLPMIAALPDGGRADRILVDCGPGSFTGVRVGLAAARGLGLGWKAGVAGFSSLPLVAAAALARTPRPSLVAVLEGGHGEVFVQGFTSGLDPLEGSLGTLQSLKPEAALAAIGDLPVVGNGVRWLQAVEPEIAAEEALPDACAVLSLPPTWRTLAPRPIYGRAPDAKPPAARG